MVQRLPHCSDNYSQFQYKKKNIQLSSCDFKLDTTPAKSDSIVACNSNIKSIRTRQWKLFADTDGV